MVLEWQPNAITDHNNSIKDLIQEWTNIPISEKIETYLQRCYSLLDHQSAKNLTPKAIKEVRQ